MGDGLVNVRAKITPILKAAGVPFFGETPEISPPKSAADIADELRKLAALRDEGIITDEEFQAQKTKLLNR